MQDDGVVTTGGVDTIHISYYCAFSDRFLDSIEKIRQAREIAENPPVVNEGGEAREPTFECEDSVYTVMPYGFSAGKGENVRATYFKYVLKAEGVTIALADRECKKDPKAKSNPNVRVEIGAMPLIWAGSVENIMPRIEQQLADMGLLIVKNRLARIDLCADLAFPIKNLQLAVWNHQYITRAKTQRLFKEFDKNSVLAGEFDGNETVNVHMTQTRETGFVIGRDKILCRGYDKLLKEAHCEDMLLALEQRRCGGTLWEMMSRIEFQLRRDALRGMAVIGEIDGIKTWEDFVKYQAEIARYLTHDWLIFTENEFDRSHTDRVREDLDNWHHNWVEVCEAFEETFGKARGEIMRLQSPMKRTAQEHITQAIGCCQSAIIKTDLNISREDPNWIEQVAVFNYIATLEQLEDGENRRRFWDRWKIKQRRQKNAIPQDAIPNPEDLASVGAGVTHGQPLEAFVLAYHARVGTPQSTPALAG